MEKHGREKDTAAWLAHEFDGGDGKTAFSVRPESPEGKVLPWPKVQRRIAQLIQEDRFYTEAEQDRFDNIDPIAIREALACLLYTSPSLPNWSCTQISTSKKHT